MKHTFFCSVLGLAIIGVMLSGCQMVNPIMESNPEALDQEDILVQHTGDPYIHGDLAPPPPPAPEEDEAELEEDELVE